MISRYRRLRLNSSLREWSLETRLSVSDFIAPVFVDEAAVAATPIDSMPNVKRYPIAEVAQEARELFDLGVPAVLLFGVPVSKDERGSSAACSDGIVQKAIAAIKAAVPQLIVITDVCLCAYTSHGHCGLLHRSSGMISSLPDGYLLNDESVELLGNIALSHARAGADMVAPSAMLDGMIAGIRSQLDANNFLHTPIMSYSVKYASSFYGPFRAATDGAPHFGDRASHQMQTGNVREAMREHEADVAEGADVIMVKPALAYLDVIQQTHRRFHDVPLVAYNVSGEYAMLHAAADKGLIDLRSTVLEVLGSIRRAGADRVITYHAKEAARWLNS